MRVDGREAFERARERLRLRDSDSLAAFLLSLAQESGPLGEQVRTFVVGDDVTETVASVRERISRLESPSDYDHRHSLGREIGVSLDFIVDSIERLVLPLDANAAFELLVALFEADGVAMENCRDYHWEVECAYERAAGLMAQAATLLPRADVEARVKALVAGDGYELRAGLVAVVLSGS